jgi:hypothetical protein
VLFKSQSLPLGQVNLKMLKLPKRLFLNVLLPTVPPQRENTREEQVVLMLPPECMLKTIPIEDRTRFQGK